MGLSAGQKPIRNVVRTQSIKKRSIELLTPPIQTTRNPATALSRFTALWYDVDTRRTLPHCGQGNPSRKISMWGPWCDTKGNSEVVVASS